MKHYIVTKQFKEVKQLFVLKWLWYIMLSALVSQVSINQR